MDTKERINIIKNHMKNKEFDDAESLINQLLEELNPQKENDEEIFYSFDNVVEDIISYYYTKPRKKTKLANAPYSLVYYYLLYISVEKKDYQNALKYANLSLEWNPVDVYTMAERAGVYKDYFNLDLYRAQVEASHKYIYNKVSLAKYYRMLGYYYIERKCYDVANALYTYSVVLDKTENAINELNFIAKQENREFLYTPQNEAAELFKMYNIPFGFSSDTVRILANEYEGIIKNPNSSDYVKNTVRRALYEMTSDKRYAPENEQNVQNQAQGTQAQTTNAQNQANLNSANLAQPTAETKVDNITEYKMINENYPTFVFKFPSELGELASIGPKVFEIRKEERQVARITMWRCGSLNDFPANVKVWIDKNIEANKMEVVSYKQELVKGFLLEVYTLKYSEKPNAPERIYKTIFLKDCAIAVASSMSNKEDIVNQIIERIGCE